MTDYDETIVQTIAVIDSAIINLRQEQLSLTKMYAKIKGIDEDKLLDAVKHITIAIMKDNGLEY